MVHLYTVNYPPPLGGGLSECFLVKEANLRSTLFFVLGKKQHNQKNQWHDYTFLRVCILSVCMFMLLTFRVDQCRQVTLMS